jgi:hypothetical protein
MICLNDKVKIWDLLKGSMSLAALWWCYGKNESSIHSTILNSMHSEHSRVLLNSISLEPHVQGYDANGLLFFSWWPHYLDCSNSCCLTFSLHTVGNYRTKELKKMNYSHAPVAHTYNPSYSGDRYQEGNISKPAGANSSQYPIPKKKKTHHKKRAGEWLKV